MSYLTAREYLIEILGEIEGIEKVYREMPEYITDIPCIILFGSEGWAEHTFGEGSMPESEETEELMLIVRDADEIVGQAAIKTFHDRLLDKLQVHHNLDRQAFIQKIYWLRPQYTRINGDKYPVQTHRIDMIIMEP